MNTRPRDLCTAAFHDDTERLRQLIVATGGVYTGRWQPPCHIDTSPAIRALLDADTPAGDEDDATRNGGRGETPQQQQQQHRMGGPSYDSAQIVSDDVAEELAELLSEEEMADLMADPQLRRVTRAYTLDPTPAEEAEEEEENNTHHSSINNDDGDDHRAESADGDDDNDLFDESEAEAAETDRQAQQHDLLIYQCLLAEQRHRESVARQLQEHGLIHVSTTPPVNMNSYGILFSCREKAVLMPHHHDETESHGNDTAAAAGTDDRGVVTSLQVRWQPSKRSRYGGTPLHWAVLARAHAMVKFLVEHGADEMAGLSSVVDTTAGAETATARGHGSATATDAVAAAKVLSQLTPAVMAAANESLPTLQVLEMALAARTADQANRDAFYTALERRMRRRKEGYAQRRRNAVARRAQQAQAQREQEEADAAAEEREREEGEWAADE
ncbi:hypothetical protein ABB37_04227 [Leptomonas pyrrhocoris]|uniref:Uncharacterized protein n=1 Tax=Leptomonas pyrrhocoris TaxID=157538 RepID=A0A0M9G205_LEPPY|nr:hypothetical protein ABB37_04227 [Leptomonas pyrrhocoris]XP_015659219.1 hypothetical protein ABB37_04227 [Leptomonas pyrrhocoris]KPA80779.1 hypothetical protein ABB37_04227 [Leptomonas pyrrhocoris]KPA80780.1 hypothetical protein ABB37_04227 [Leptomonas pyrrhocoris]|eukprot:XP_015659218.1 hypothetical protein ABB37_04227 [Leptomonas pyrrhocoris]